MKFLERRRQRRVQELLDSIKPIDKSDRERCKFIVKISGVQMDDLDNPPREIPFSREVYKETEEEAMKIGKLEYANGNKVEIWHLVKRSTFGCRRNNAWCVNLNESFSKQEIPYRPYSYVLYLESSHILNFG